MKIICINAGSSSLKFTLFNMVGEEEIAAGLFERIGISGGCYKITYGDDVVKSDIQMNDHKDAVSILLDKLLSLGIVSSLDEIEGVGHRVVSGGEKYSKSIIIDDTVVNDLVDLTDFAPLHNPAHVLGIRAIKEALPSVPMVAVFDTAFHQTMDPVTYLYPVPYSWYTDYGIRKYGAHGTSHRYVTKKISEHFKRDDLKIINCHLGNGSSICAIKDGKCVDTSMGLTPLAGVMMGTRSGDIDPSIIPFIMNKTGMSADEVISDLNRKSGLLGLGLISSDARDNVTAVSEGNEQAIIATEKLVKTVVSYIANYYVLLGGVDVITFTAGIGEKSIYLRTKIAESLSCLGYKLDEKTKDAFSEFTKISSDDSPVMYVVPTNEELMIARDTLELIR